MAIVSTTEQQQVKHNVVTRYFNTQQITEVSYENFLEHHVSKPTVSLKEFMVIYEAHYHINYLTRNDLSVFALFKNNKIVALNYHSKNQLEGIVNNGKIVPVSQIEGLELNWLMHTKVANAYGMLLAMRNNTYDRTFIVRLLNYI